MSQIAFVCKGILGRKRQSILLLAAIGIFFAFIAASLCYFTSAQTAQIQRRYDLYGEWEAAQYALAQADVSAFSQAQRPERMGIAVQAGIFAEPLGLPLGSIGYADDAYFTLGRLTPLSGRLPLNANEVAMTANALDSLGYSYELGQEIQLTLMDVDAVPLSGAPVYPAAFILSGVLPSYEIFWNTGNQLPITAVVRPDAALPLQSEGLCQVFYSFSEKRGKGIAENFKETSTGVYNDFAYPDENEQDYIPAILIAVSLLLSFFAVAQLFRSSLQKRELQRNTLRALGAAKGHIMRLYWAEGLVYLFAALPIGTATGVGLCVLGLYIQGAAQYFTLPGGMLAVSVLLCGAAVMLGFLLPALRQTRKRSQASAITREYVKLRKRLRLALPIQGAEAALALLCLLLVMGCAGFANWRFLPYLVNKDYAAININTTSERVLQPQLLEDLRSIPSVTEISAVALSRNDASLSSPAIAQSKMLRELYENSTLDITNQWQMRSENELRTCLISPSPDVMEALAGLCENPDATRKALEAENAVILYLPSFERDSVSGTYGYADFDDADTREAVDTGLGAGQSYTFSMGNYVSGDAGDGVDLLFERDITVAGVIRRFPSDLLMGNGLPLSAASMFSSRAFYADACYALGFPRDHATGYTNVNIRLQADAGFSTRQSIASIVQKRGGLIRANSYETVEQAYQSGMQSIFLFGVAALLLGGMGMLLMQNVFLSRLQAEAPNIGLLIAMGASRRGIRRQYWKRGLLLCAVALGCVTALAAVFQWAVKEFPWMMMGLTKVFTMGAGRLAAIYPRTYPWLVHGAVCAVMAAYILGLHAVSLRGILKKSPMENMREL